MRACGGGGVGRTLDLRISLTPAPILLHPSHHFLLLAPLPRYLYLTTLAFPLLCADLPHYLRQTIATYVMLGTISSLRLFKGAPDHEKAGLELLVAQHMRPVDIAPGVNRMCVCDCDDQDVRRRVAPRRMSGRALGDSLLWLRLLLRESLLSCLALPDICHMRTLRLHTPVPLSPRRLRPVPAGRGGRPPVGADGGHGDGAAAPGRAHPADRSLHDR